MFEFPNGLPGLTPKVATFSLEATALEGMPTDVFLEHCVPVLSAGSLEILLHMLWETWKMKWISRDWIIIQYFPPEGAAIFRHHKKIVKVILRAGTWLRKRAWTRREEGRHNFWRMTYPKEYHKLIKSNGSKASQILFSLGPQSASHMTDPEGPNCWNDAPTY